jgi:hypothetical protein
LASQDLFHYFWEIAFRLVATGIVLERRKNEIEARLNAVTLPSDINALAERLKKLVV